MFFTLMPLNMDRITGQKQSVQRNSEDTTSFLTIIYISDTFVGSHKNWSTVTKEGYEIIDWIQEIALLPL